VEQTPAHAQHHVAVSPDQCREGSLIVARQELLYKFSIRSFAAVPRGCEEKPS
jgi:hypothetical protein